MDVNEILDIVREEDFDVTLSGGDPMYHPEIVAFLAREIRALGHSVWVYTGFTWEEIQADKVLLNALPDVEAIVEGPYIEDLRDTDLLFRGSSNQRIIRLRSEKCEPGIDESDGSGLSDGFIPD